MKRESQPNENRFVQEIVSKRFDQNFSIITDTETNVKYLLVETTLGCGLCRLVEKDEIKGEKQE